MHRKNQQINLHSMNIKIHRARVHVSYASPEFHSQYRGRIIATLAAVCIEGWRHNHWPGEGPPPPLPDTYEGVVSAYFWGSGEEGDDGPWLEWDEIEVDLSPNFDAPVVIGAGGYALSVARVSDAPGEPAFVISSDLFGDDGDLPEALQNAADAIESLVLALASAGFPVHLPEFGDALGTCVEAVSENLG